MWQGPQDLKADIQKVCSTASEANGADGIGESIPAAGASEGGATMSGELRRGI